jgi:hypothetical protein
MKPGLPPVNLPGPIEIPATPKTASSPYSNISKSPKKELRSSPRKLIQKTSFRKLPPGDLSIIASPNAVSSGLPSGTHSSNQTNSLTNCMKIDDILSEQFKYFRLEFIEAASQVGVTIPLDIVEDTTGRIFNFIKFNGPKYILQMLPANTENVHLVRCSLSLLMTSVSILSRKLPEADKPQSAYWSNNAIGESISQWANDSLNDIIEAGVVSVIINLMMRTNIATVVELCLSLISSLIMISDEAAMSMFYPLNSVHASDRRPIRHRKKVLLHESHLDEPIVMPATVKTINMERLRSTLSPITRRTKRNQLLVNTKTSLTSPSTSPKHDIANASPISLIKSFGHRSKKSQSNQDPTSSIVQHSGSCLSFVLSVLNKYHNKFMIIGGYADLVLAICTLEGTHICSNIAMTTASPLPQFNSHPGGHHNYHLDDDVVTTKSTRKQHHSKVSKPATTSSSSRPGTAATESMDNVEGWDGIKLPLSILARFLKYDEEWHSNYISNRQRDEMVHVFCNILLAISHLIIGSATVTAYAANLTGAEEVIRFGYEQLKQGFDEEPASTVKQCLQTIVDYREEVARIERSKIRVPKKPKEFKVKRLEDAERVAASRLAAAVEAVTKTTNSSVVDDLNQAEQRLASRRVSKDGEDYHQSRSGSRRASTAAGSDHRRGSTYKLLMAGSLELDNVEKARMNYQLKRENESYRNLNSDPYSADYMFARSAHYDIKSLSHHIDHNAKPAGLNRIPPSTGTALADDLSSSRPTTSIGLHDHHDLQYHNPEYPVRRGLTERQQSNDLDLNRNFFQTLPSMPKLPDIMVDNDVLADTLPNLCSDPQKYHSLVDSGREHFDRVSSSVVRRIKNKEEVFLNGKSLMPLADIYERAYGGAIDKLKKLRKRVMTAGATSSTNLSFGDSTTIRDGRARGDSITRTANHIRVATALTTFGNHLHGTRSSSHDPEDRYRRFIDSFRRPAGDDLDGSQSFHIIPIPKLASSAAIDGAGASSIDQAAGARPSTSATTSSKMLSMENHNKLSTGEAISLLGFKLDEPTDDTQQLQSPPLSPIHNEDDKTSFAEEEDNVDDVYEDEDEDADREASEAEADEGLVDNINDYQDHNDDEAIDDSITAEEEQTDSSLANRRDEAASPEAVEIEPSTCDHDHESIETAGSENQGEQIDAAGDDQGDALYHDEPIDAHIADQPEPDNKESVEDIVVDGAVAGNDGELSDLRVVADDQQSMPSDHNESVEQLQEPSSNETSNAAAESRPEKQLPIKTPMDSLTVSLSSTPRYFISSFGPSPRMLNLRTPRTMKSAADYEIEAIVQSALTSPKSLVTLSTKHSTSKSKASKPFF